MTSTVSSNATRPVAWSPTQPHQFISYSLANGLELFEISNNSNGKTMSRQAQKRVDSQVTCLEWYPVPHQEQSIVAFGTGSGQVSIVTMIGEKEIKLCESAKVDRRSCHDISWNKAAPTLLTASFEVTKSEHALLVWNLENKNFEKLAEGESSTAVRWLPTSSSILACGNKIGWIKFYDTRASNFPVISLKAYQAQRPRSIKGIRFDPFDANIFATFTDTAGEAIKFWDIRKVQSTDSSKGVISATLTLKTPDDKPSESSRTGQAATTDFAWSPNRRSLFAVAYSNQKSIYFYSTNFTDSNNIACCPLFVSSLMDYPKSLSWIRYYNKDQVKAISITGHLWEGKVAESRGEGFSSYLQLQQKQSNNSIHSIGNTKIIDTMNVTEEYDYFRQIFTSSSYRDSPLEWSKRYDRLMISTANGFLDMNVVEQQSLSFGAQSNLAFSWGRSISVNTITDSNESAISTEFYYSTEQLMKSRCLSKYSFLAGDNIAVLSKELDHYYSVLNGGFVKANSIDTVEQSSILSRNAMSSHELYRVWDWIESMEIESMESGKGMIIYTGIMDLLRPMSNSNTSVISGQIAATNINSRCCYNWALGAYMYTAECRKEALASCSKMFEDSQALTFSFNPHHPLDKSDDNIYYNNASHHNNSHQMESGSISSGISQGDRDREYGHHMDQNTTEVSDAVPLSTANVLADLIEDEESVERAATLALFSGRIDLAVRILQTAFLPHLSGRPNSYSQTSASTKGLSTMYISWDAPISKDYEQLLSMVGMCFAGFAPVSQGKQQQVQRDNRYGLTPDLHRRYQHKLLDSRYEDENVYEDEDDYSTKTERISAVESQQASWISMCSYLRDRLNNAERKSAAYLAAACHFLLENLNHQQYHAADTEFAVPPGYLRILNNRNLWLKDRVAFALLFLPDKLLFNWVADEQAFCETEGLLDGLLLTGFNSDGVKLLQTFLDKTNDIQTSALLVSRCPNKSVKFPLWIQEYRSILDRWGYFIERAYFDVEAGKYMRKQSKLSGGYGRANLVANATRRLAGSAVGTGSYQRRNIWPTVMNEQPFVELKCNFCNFSVPTDCSVIRDDKNKMETRRNQRTLLNCCGNCMKPLPRCYVCHLYVGFVNPLYQFKERQPSNLYQEESAAAGNQHVIGIENWLFFCQHCGHGGHGSCINQWFNGSAGSSSTFYGTNTIIKQRHQQQKLTGYSNEEDHFRSKEYPRVVCGVNGCCCHCKRL